LSSFASDGTGEPIIRWSQKGQTVAALIKSPEVMIMKNSGFVAREWSERTGHKVAFIKFDLSIPFVLNRLRPSIPAQHSRSTKQSRAPRSSVIVARREDDMDVQTDERLLRNIEGYLMELVCNVENIHQVNLVADVLVAVQDALRDLAQKPRFVT
jgi:hypothetical protein